MPEEAPIEATAETPPRWEGLVFDRSKEIRRALGPEISKEEAKALEGAHLQDELMIEQRMRNIYTEPEDEDTVQDVLQTVRRYRENNGLTLTYTADEIRNLLPADSDFNEQFINELAGVDLANREAVLEVAERNLGSSDAVRGAHHIETLVTNQVLADRDEKSEAGETHSWNNSLKEFFPNLVKDVQILAYDLRVPEETRDKAKEYLKSLGAGLGKAGKEIVEAVKIKDWREASTLGIQLLTDFSPEVGEAFMVFNLSMMGAQEIQTIKDVMQKKDPSSWTIVEYLKQTTLGEIVAGDPNSRLKNWERYSAGAVGLLASAGAFGLSRLAQRGVRAPGASALCRSAVARSFQYFLPKVLDLAAEKVVAKAGGLETDEKRTEWVDRTLQSSRWFTTVLASASMGARFISEHRPVPGAPRQEGPFRDVNRIIGQTGEIVGDAAHQAADTIIELKDEAVGGIQHFTEIGVHQVQEQLVEARDIVQHEVNQAVADVQQEVGVAKDAWEHSDTRQGLQDLRHGLEEARDQYKGFFERLDHAIKDFKSEVTRPETVTEGKEVKIPDGLEKGRGFDTNLNGKDDSWWLVDEKGGRIEAALQSDGKILDLGSEGGAKGVIAEYILHDMLKASPDPSGADSLDKVYQANPLANPDLVGRISTEITDSLHLNSAGDARELINSPNMALEVVEIYKDLVVGSAIDWVKDRVPIDAIGDFFKELQLNVDPKKLDPNSIPQELKNMEGVTVTHEGKTYSWKDVSNFQWKEWIENFIREHK